MFLSRRRSRNSRPVSKKRTFQFEHLEPRQVMDATLVISEFLAVNKEGLEDADGDRSDWIELYNPTDAAVSLDGWHLEDSAERWTFPSASLDPGRYLTVFASGKDRTTGDELHTNFRLDGDGERLALLQPDGTVVHEYTDVPKQKSDIAYGIGMTSTETTLIAPGAQGRGITPDANITLAWSDLNYDDSAWIAGPSGFGFGENGAVVNTILPNVDPGGQYNYVKTIYARVPFAVSDTTKIDTLKLGVQFNDAFGVYLNGTFITSRNVWFEPDDEVTYHSNHAAFGYPKHLYGQVYEIDLTEHRDLLIEGNNVLAAYALNDYHTKGDLFIAPQLSSTFRQITSPEQTGYLPEPTPNQGNVGSHVGLVSDTKFSHDRGTYDAAFDLEITTDTPETKIVYTTDGSLPTVDDNLNVTNGTLYTAALPISQTTTLRAAAFKADHAPSNVDTQTYLFIDDVINQSPNGEVPAGWPKSGKINGQKFRYGMQDAIVNNEPGKSQIRDAFDQIPSLSIVTEMEHLFDKYTGIYTNPGVHGKGTHGILWERPTSVELIDPSGGDQFQIDAGIRIRGGGSRGGGTAKHSFRLFFRGEYGEKKLNFPLFGDEGADRFDKIDLRTAQNNSTGSSKYTFLRDIFARDSQGAMGQPYKRGDYYHLYLNGQYWGMYQTDERSEDRFASEYLGGKPEEYDVIKPARRVVVANNGNLDALQTLVEMSDSDGDFSNGVDKNGYQDDATYFKALGKNPDGTDNPAFEKHLDIDNLIDYVILTLYIKNKDGPTTIGGTLPNNYFALRRRGLESDGWKFFVHDSEWTLDVGGGVSTGGGRSTGAFHPMWLHSDLLKNSHYKLRFADRMEKHLRNGGALTPAASVARWNARVGQMDQAVVAELARWGDSESTQAEWQAKVDAIANSTIPGRTQGTLSTFSNIYPNFAAPVISQFGGEAIAGTTVTLSSPDALPIYYTTDGSDPMHEATGAISSEAILYDANSPIELLVSQKIRARALKVTSGTNSWSAQIDPEFTVDFPLRITELMYHPTEPTDAEITAGFSDDDDFEYVELQNTSDQPISLANVQFVEDAHGDGIEFLFDAAEPSLGAGERIIVTRNRDAFLHRHPTPGLRLAIGEYSGKLSNSSEHLILTMLDTASGVIQDFTYEDDWYKETDGKGYSLTVSDTPGDGKEASNWRGSALINGSPGVADPEPNRANFNGDGVVDRKDITILLAHLGMLTDVSRIEGDTNGDGKATLADLANLQSALGDTITLPSPSPQPSAAASSIVTESPAPALGLSTTESVSEVLTATRSSQKTTTSNANGAVTRKLRSRALTPRLSRPLELATEETSSKSQPVTRDHGLQRRRLRSKAVDLVFSSLPEASLPEN